MLENIRAILRANGADMQDVVNVTVYVTDMRAFHDIADIRLEYFPEGWAGERDRRGLSRSPYPNC